MADHDRNECPDCRRSEPAVNRRDFVRGVGSAVAVSGIWPILGGASRALAAAPDQRPSPSSPPETAAKALYESLSSEQKEKLCFPFEHDLRKRISANWAITELKIDDLKPDQQELVRTIVKGITSPDGYERFMKQMDDDSAGFEQYHIALFGEPGTDRFQFELTGRHVTMRADGNSVAGAAFGGPIVYGHGEGDGKKGLPGNVFYYQTKKANEVFQALEGKQREAALVAKAPPEAAVQLRGADQKLPGVRVGELSSDQRKLVEEVLRIGLAPYRAEDIEEAMDIMKAGGGLDALHMAFYQSDDLGDDKEWDIWRVEGPTFVWHFRGAPHVHAYLNVSERAKKS